MPSSTGRKAGNTCPPGMAPKQVITNGDVMNGSVIDISIEELEKKSAPKVMTVEQVLKRFCHFDNATGKFNIKEFHLIAGLIYRCLENGLLAYIKRSVGGLIRTDVRLLKALIRTVLPTEKASFFLRTGKEGTKEIRQRNEGHIPICFRKKKDSLLTRDYYWETQQGQQQLTALHYLFKVDELALILSKEQPSLTAGQYYAFLTGEEMPVDEAVVEKHKATAETKSDDGLHIGKSRPPMNASELGRLGAQKKHEPNRLLKTYVIKECLPKYDSSDSATNIAAQILKSENFKKKIKEVHYVVEEKTVADWIREKRKQKKNYV